MAPASANPTLSDRAGDREVYGPLEIEREVKDDDRSLILYTHREGVDTKLYTHREGVDTKLYPQREGAETKLCPRREGSHTKPPAGPERAGA
jgi:hypothetical protein